jgi:hypothetical protein
VIGGGHFESNQPGQTEEKGYPIQSNLVPIAEESSCSITHPMDTNILDVSDAHICAASADG